MAIHSLRKAFYDFRKFSPLVEYWAYWLAENFDNSHKTKFIIFGQGRTGSTLLINLLSQHPEIFADNELLQRGFAAPFQYLEGRALMNLKKGYGLKLKPDQIFKHLREPSSKNTIHKLHQDSWHIIYIRRSNFFRHALSNDIAMQRGYFISDKKTFDQLPQVYIDPDNFKRALKARFKFQDDEANALKGIPFTEVNYEQDLLTPEQRASTLANLYNYLGVNPNFTPEIPFLRTTPDDLSRILSNFEELCEIAQDQGVEVQ